VGSVGAAHCIKLVMRWLVYRRIHLKN